jgi:hypothetical protein
MALLDQTITQVRTEEPGCAGDENTHLDLHNRF